MSSVQLKHNAVIFSLCSAINLLFEIFPLIYIVLWYFAVDVG